VTVKTACLSASLAVHRNPRTLRSMLELMFSALAFVGLWTAMWWLRDKGFLLTLVLAIPTAGFMVRLFMIQHDCGHGSFFKSRLANDWIGRFISVFTLTPYDFWRQSHAMHHAGVGNLDRRGIGDIDMLTVREFQALRGHEWLRYRLYRNPLVMFGLGPAYLFLFRNRLPFGAMRSGAMPWISTMLTNLATAAAAGVVIYAVGAGTFLAIQIPVVLIGASIGVWLFFVQHQFERTYWEHQPDWSHPEAALHGSSFYDLPRLLMWMTGNIGIHHLHHLSCRIPFYNLPTALADHPQLRQVGRLTLWQSLRCARLSLWDEDKRRLVSFAEARAARASV
jgi:acyl-lipid omega-6 desaturase (Delta-12 desaturase)